MDGTAVLDDEYRCLEILSAARLRELVETAGVTAADRRSKTGLLAALAGARIALGDLLTQLRLAELKRIAGSLALDAGGRSKGDVIERIVSARPRDTRPPASSSTPPPMSARSAGSLKSALRRFALEARGGFRGPDVPVAFATALLKCFGWENGYPPGVDMPATLRIAEHGQRTTREVTALWNDRRVLIEVTKPDAMLDFAWKELVRACLQLDPVPQYVVLTNGRDLHLYDLARDRDKPRLAIPIEDLPKQSEAFPFLTDHWVPGSIPVIVNNTKVSREVADLVAKLYRSLKAAHPKRDDDIAKFTLQCIIAMFAEDIGLLPQEYFTSLLYEGARHRDVEKRLGELFRLMSEKEVSGHRAVPFFNGGLFTDPVSLRLDDAQLGALTKAAEANWTYVDPHIFGSVFQGIMNDAERHASGVHYTAQDDIMRVVGPTIVEPWRKRIREATTLTELLQLRAELFRFRVLDPACGSGNFLYVAFRELYKLDTDLLLRMVREFKSAEHKLHPGGIPTSNFYGIEINRFAVELAKVTLNIAKKIAFDERREALAELSDQTAIDIDPSLPLDNLDRNIVCADALFTEWPEVEAIVGNPPFLGGSKIRQELGEDYLRKLQNDVGADAIVDLACYWFRRAHTRLADGARAGLVATSGIRVGKARKASLDYIMANGGTITNAVSSRAWPGDSAVNVSMINWVKCGAPGPHTLVIEDQRFELARIPSHLQLHTDVSSAIELAANALGRSEGVKFDHEAFRSDSAGFPASQQGVLPCIRPVATADDMLRGKLPLGPDYCIYLTSGTEKEARAEGGPAFEHLKARVFPALKGRADSRKDANVYASWVRRWWQPWAPRLDFFARLAGSSRFLVVPTVASRPAFAFISAKFVPNNTLAVFAFSDDYTFGVIQSTLHWQWTKAKGGKVTERFRYTNDVWTTFPWPQSPPEEPVVRVAERGRELRRVRQNLMDENGWSLRTLYQAAEVPGPHPLKDAQHALDEAVSAAYGVPPDQDGSEFLLELNGLLAEDEAQGLEVQGPGLPRGFDPKDPRWTSDDCIEPPPIEGSRT